MQSEERHGKTPFGLIKKRNSLFSHLLDQIVLGGTPRTWPRQQTSSLIIKMIDIIFFYPSLDETSILFCIVRCFLFQLNCQPTLTVYCKLFYETLSKFKPIKKNLLELCTVGLRFKGSHPSADWIRLTPKASWWRPRVKQLGKYFVGLTSLLTLNSLLH